MSIVPEWFDKRRGLALGIASAGQCLGALVLPLLMTTLNTNLNVQWCYRIIGLMMLVSGAIACAMFKGRKNTNKGDSNSTYSSSTATEKKKTQPKLKEIFDFQILRNHVFLLWCLADILMEAAYYVPYFYLPAHATQLKLSPSQGSALISVASGMNLLGRLACGFIADRIGHINTVIVFGIITTLSCFLMWTFVSSYGLLVAFAAVFGFFGGSFLTLVSAVTVVIVGIEQLQSAFSVFLVMTVICMFGPSVAGTLEKSVSWKPFLSYQVFTGIGYAAGVLIMLIIKLLVERRFFAKI